VTCHAPWVVDSSAARAYVVFVVFSRSLSAAKIAPTRGARAQHSRQLLLKHKPAMQPSFWQVAIEQPRFVCFLDGSIPIYEWRALTLQ